TWVDSYAWGFAPFHYGRWAYIGSRWGWIPGPRQHRAVYCPALVAFVGGNNWNIGISSGRPIGWFPLGPRDVFVPWYRSSRNYFGNVNYANIRNTTVINNTYITNVYNNYSNGRPTNVDYAYRRDHRAVTAVPENVFRNARPVGDARMRLDRDALARAEVVNRIAVTPVAASLARAGIGRVAKPPVAIADRQVIGRAAAPAVVPFSQRQAAIARNGGQPLDSEALNQLRGERSAAAERVRVVAAGAKPMALPDAREGGAAAADRRNTDRSRFGQRPAELRNPAPAAHADRTQPAKPDPTTERATAPGPAQPLREDLPSSRFAPQNRRLHDNIAPPDRAVETPQRSGRERPREQNNAAQQQVLREPTARQLQKPNATTRPDLGRQRTGASPDPQESQREAYQRLRRENADHQQPAERLASPPVQRTAAPVSDNRQQLMQQQNALRQQQVQQAQQHEQRQLQVQQQQQQQQLRRNEIQQQRQQQAQPPAAQPPPPAQRQHEDRRQKDKDNGDHR
ncbi:MAG: DUF6600 domain-containing protein, partial [Dokdonella sp.]